jgi:hypothetical protein
MFGPARGLALGVTFCTLAATCHANFLSTLWGDNGGREVDLQDPSHSLHETKKGFWSEWLSKFKPHPVKTTQRKLQSDAAKSAEKWQSKDPNTYPPERMAQRLALVTLYYATDGEGSWTDDTNWLSYTVSECEWFSNLDADDVCNGDDYIRLDLSGNNLTGLIPDEVFAIPDVEDSGLPKLTLIDLSKNNIAGNIPTTVGSVQR